MNSYQTKTAKLMTVPEEATNKPYTPGLIGRIYAQSVSSSVEKNPVFIQGIYTAAGKKPYNDGFYYDILKDEVTNEQLSMLVHESLRINLESGHVYLFKGAIAPKPNSKDKIGVTITFTPSEIVGSESPKIDDRTVDMIRIFREKTLKRNVNVDKVLLQKLYDGQKPRIGVLYGSEGIVDRDVQSSLGEFASAYEISEHRINLSDKQIIIGAIRKAATMYDAVCIVRGGGSGLDIFDDIDIAEAVVNLTSCPGSGNPVPFICAIGHSSDNTFIRQIADKFCATPTALGTYLADLVRQNQKIKVEIKEITREIDVSGIKKRMFTYGATAATAGIIALYILAKVFIG